MPSSAAATTALIVAAGFSRYVLVRLDSVVLLLASLAGPGVMGPPHRKRQATGWVPDHPEIKEHKQPLILMKGRTGQLVGQWPFVRMHHADEGREAMSELTFKETTLKLKGILRKITESITPEEKSAVRQEIVDYIDDDLPLGPAFEEVRRIARETFEDLGRSVKASSLSRVRARIDQLIGHAQTVTAVAAEAENTLKLQRLQLAHQVTNSTAGALEQLRVAQEALAEKDDAKAAEHITAATTSLLAIQRRITEE
jgi:hypothetical protein